MTKSDPFKGFHSRPEPMGLAVGLRVRFPLSHRNVKDLLHERCVDISDETVWYCWHRFGPMFAAEIRKRRIEDMKSSRRRWCLDEIFVKISGECHCLWWGVDQGGRGRRGRAH